MDKSDLRIQIYIKITVFFIYEAVIPFIRSGVGRIKTGVIKKIIIKTVSVIDVVANYIAGTFDNQITSSGIIFPLPYFRTGHT